MKKLLILISLFMLISIVISYAADRGITLKETLKEMKTERRVALIIGNSSYQSESPLKNPVNDARLMDRVLSELGFKVIKVENASQTQMKKAIDQFGNEIRNGGVGLFYYAGHGMQINGTNYLIPVNANLEVENDVEYEGVDVGRVLGKMDAARNRLNIVMLDACRDNPFARSFRSASKGLATVDAPRGTFIAYATAPGSVAADGEGNNGLFTSEFVDALRVDGRKIEDVFKQVRLQIMQKTGDKQIPWESSSLTGDFYFKVPVEERKPNTNVEIVQEKRPEYREAPNRSKYTYEGKIREKINASGYSYIKLETDSQVRWIALPECDFEVGSTIYVPEGMPMENYHSKALNKTFSLLTFVDEVVSADLFYKDIDSILAKSHSLKGKVVDTKGKVVNYSEDIMGVNWVHLSDNGKNDIVITTQDKTKIGDYIHVEGKVVPDKDFGYGYKYDVILEDGKIKGHD